MKKLITFVAVLAMLIPLSAMAMTPVADSELAEVTGQMGVDIAIVDFTMDLSIDNIAWGDTDVSAGADGIGQYYVGGHAVSFTQGYININDFAMTNLFVTLNGTTGTSAGATISAADPLKIDVATINELGPGCPFPCVAGNTAIVITLPDMHVQIQSITIGGIYLDDAAYANDSYTFSGGTAGTDTWYADPYATLDATKNLGTMQIDGLDMKLYSSVPVWNSTLGEYVAFDTNGNHVNVENNARVYILAH